MIIYIYELIDPRIGLPFYVGKTNNLRVRLKGHWSGGGKTRCADYIREMRSAGVKPVIKILEECDEGTWENAEAYWVSSHLRVYGCCQMQNVNEGGVQEGRFLTHSEATRQRMREMFLGRPIPQEQRDQISKSLTGKKQSPETIAKRLAGINKTRAEKGKPLLGEGHELSLQRRRDKRRADGILPRTSEEARAKASDKQREVWKSMTPEQREVHAARRRGVATTAGMKFGPFSPERKAQQSAKLKAYIATLTPDKRAARMSAAREAKKAKYGHY